jgi:anti-sigma factor RsiW
MARNPCPVPAVLHAYVMGLLEDAELQHVARHASKCPRCQARLLLLDTVCDDLLARVRQPLETGALTVEPALERALAEVGGALPRGTTHPQAPAGTVFVPAPGRSMWRRLAFLTLATVAVAAALVTSCLVSRPTPPPTDAPKTSSK